MRKICTFCKEFKPVFVTISPENSNDGTEKYNCEDCGRALAKLIPVLEDKKCFDVLKKIFTK